jgi:hypothetical protein
VGSAISITFEDVVGILRPMTPSRLECLLLSTQFDCPECRSAEKNRKQDLVSGDGNVARDGFVHKFSTDGYNSCAVTNTFVSVHILSRNRVAPFPYTCVGT